VKLNVAGAYHSRLMQSAADALSPTLSATPMQSPRCPVLANFTAAAVITPDEIRSALASQVTGSVRWTETIERLVDVEKVELFLELGPGGIIAGLVKRTRKDIPVISITDCATLDAAVAQLQ
jgi:[acyl-carrier-protein] S-malonyltransferase